jgi:radical SAM protein with 4Fe4S-binding SPASM domain
MASSADEQDYAIQIPLDFAFVGISDALSGTPTGIKAEILRFFSPGEPTQAMDVIRSSVEYARKLNPTIQVELQTNGLFPSLADTEWIANNINVIWFSLDGAPEINDLHRPDEHGNGRTSEIENNMAIVQKKAFVGVRSTVVEEMIDRQDELVAYYKKLGIDYICLNPIIRQIKRNDELNNEVTRNDIMTFAHNFLKAYNYGVEHGVKVSSSLSFNFDQSTCVSCRSCLPMPQLNPDGSVSSCDMALYKDTKKSLRCFIYGEWDNNTHNIRYFDDKISILRSRTLDNLPKCQKCNIREYCAGGCAGRVAFQTGSIFDIIPQYCDATRHLAASIRCGENAIRYTHP